MQSGDNYAISKNSDYKFDHRIYNSFLDFFSYSSFESDFELHKIFNNNFFTKKTLYLNEKLKSCESNFKEIFSEECQKLRDLLEKTLYLQNFNKNQKIVFYLTYLFEDSKIVDLVSNYDCNERSEDVKFFWDFLPNTIKKSILQSLSSDLDDISWISISPEVKSLLLEVVNNFKNIKKINNLLNFDSCIDRNSLFSKLRTLFEEKINKIFDSGDNNFSDLLSIFYSYINAIKSYDFDEYNKKTNIQEKCILFFQKNNKNIENFTESLKEDNFESDEISKVKHNEFDNSIKQTEQPLSEDTNITDKMQGFY